MPPVFPSGSRSPLRRFSFFALLLLSWLGFGHVLAQTTTEPTPAGNSQASQATQSGPTDAIVEKRARLRAGASAHHPVLSTLPAGLRLEIIGSDGDFYQVRYQGRSGWVAKDLLKPIQAPGNAANASPPANSTAPVPETTLPRPTATETAPPDKLPPPPPTIVVPPPVASSNTDADLPWLWLLLALAGGALGGFMAGYHWRESYYRKRLYGLRL